MSAAKRMTGTGGILWIVPEQVAAVTSVSRNDLPEIGVAMLLMINGMQISVQHAPDEAATILWPPNEAGAES